MAHSPLPNWAEVAAQVQVGACELSVWASYHWLFYFYELANLFSFLYLHSIYFSFPKLHQLVSLIFLVNLDPDVNCIVNIFYISQSYYE